MDFSKRDEEFVLHQPNIDVVFFVRGSAFIQSLHPLHVRISANAAMIEVDSRHSSVSTQAVLEDPLLSQSR